MNFFPISVSLAIALLVIGCATSPSASSNSVIQYESVDEMRKHCSSSRSLGGISVSYNVTMHSPWGRNRAARIRLREAAANAGANAVVMTSNDWGVVTDTVQGIAFWCSYD